MAWLTGWSYRRQITITENSGTTLPNYQVLVELDTSTIIGQGHMESDGGDIRFTDDDGITELNYYIEGPIPDSASKLWVKVSSITGSGSKTIYVYYGKSAETTTSNGFNVFEFFEDWTTGTPSSRWNVVTGVFETIYDANIGEQCVRLRGGTGRDDNLLNNNTINDWADKGFEYDFKFRWETFGSYGPRVAHGQWRQSDSFSQVFNFYERGGGSNAAQLLGTGYTNAYNYDDWTLGQVYHIVCRRQPSYLWLSKDGGSTMWFNNTSGSSSTVNGVTYYLRSWDTNQDCRIGLIKSRKLATTEPGVSVGGEEVPLPTVTTISPATGITKSAATCSGNIINTGGVGITCSIRGICYGLNPNPDTSGDKVQELDSFGTGVFSENLTGLSNLTTYHYRAFATNISGTGYGSDETFMTFDRFYPKNPVISIKDNVNNYEIISNKSLISILSKQNNLEIIE